MLGLGVSWEAIVSRLVTSLRCLDRVGQVDRLTLCHLGACGADLGLRVGLLLLAVLLARHHHDVGVCRDDGSKQQGGKDERLFHGNSLVGIRIGMRRTGEVRAKARANSVQLIPDIYLNNSTNKRKSQSVTMVS